MIAAMKEGKPKESLPKEEESGGLTKSSSPAPADIQQQPSCPPYPGLSQPVTIGRSNILPLQEMPGGEFGPIKVHTPFSLQDLRQIKADLGKFSEDPDKYIEVFQNLCQVFDLTWKDIMLLLNQTLTSNEKEATLRQLNNLGMTYTLLMPQQHRLGANLTTHREHKQSLRLILTGIRMMNNMLGKLNISKC